MPDPILYDSHMHTPLCKHATGEPEAYAAQAEKRGLRGIVITCHSPYPGDTYDFRWRMRADQVDEYLALVERARVAWEGRVDVRLGMECDYFPGHEPWLAELTARTEFDYLLGSVHPDTVEYKAAFNGQGPVALQRSYFGHLADAAESGLFDCLSHPDLVKNEAPDEWVIERVLDDIRAALDRIAATGVAMELNTSGLHKRVKEMCPGPILLAEMAARGIPVVLGSDSHGPERVADDFETALDLLADTGHPCVYVYQRRQRQAIPIAVAQASLKAVVS